MKKTRKKLRNSQAGDITEKQQLSRMLARCSSCVKDYIPRGRGETEVSNLKLFYISNEKLNTEKKGLVCPMHKDKREPAGLILSEDCLQNKFGSAMGMVAFCFSDSEVENAKQNQIWPKPRVKAKIELDAEMLSSLSDEQIFKMIKLMKNEVGKESEMIQKINQEGI